MKAIGGTMKIKEQATYEYSKKMGYCNDCNCGEECCKNNRNLCMMYVDYHDTIYEEAK